MISGVPTRVGLALLLTNLGACGGNAGDAAGEELVVDPNPISGLGADAAADAASSDADSGSEVGAALDCSLGGTTFAATVSSGQQPFALDVSTNDGLLVYAVPSCANANGLPGAASLNALTMPSSGAVPDAVPFAPGDECAASGEPAVAGIPGRLGTGFYARRTESAAQLFALDLNGGAEPLKIASAEGRLSVASGAGAIANTALVAWATSAPGELATDLRLFDATGDAAGEVLVGMSAGQRVRSVKVAGLGAGTEARRLGVVAWVDEAPDAAAVRMQLVNQRGKLVGDPMLVTDQVGTFSVVDAVAHDAGGALIYTEGAETGRHRIRLQVLDEGGAPLGEPVKITGIDEDVRGAAVARYAAGYAVAYRSLRADPAEKARIRIAFTDASGNLAGTRDAATAERNAGPLQLAEALDGRLFMAFTDEPQVGPATLRVVRVLCP